MVHREPLHFGVQHRFSRGRRTASRGSHPPGPRLDRVAGSHPLRAVHLRLKDSGLWSFPFTKIEVDRNWTATVRMVADLLRGSGSRASTVVSERLTPGAAAGPASPPSLVHAAAFRCSHLRCWPTADALLGVYVKMAALC